MLRELLTLWFAVGFLDLQRVTWTSPCDIVQKVGLVCMRACVRVCVHVCVYVCMRVCGGWVGRGAVLCLCVTNRERERESVCVCVCILVNVHTNVDVLLNFKPVLLLQSLVPFT